MQNFLNALQDVFTIKDFPINLYNIKKKIYLSYYVNSILLYFPSNEQ